jgi:hypothetical protein
VGDHDRAGRHHAAARERHAEALAPPLGGHDGVVADLDRRMFFELLTGLGAQVPGRRVSLAEQPADRVDHRVRRRSGVQHHHAAPRPAEHQRGAQASGPAADDQHVDDGPLGEADDSCAVVDGGGHGDVGSDPSQAPESSVRVLRASRCRLRKLRRTAPVHMRGITVFSRGRLPCPIPYSAGGM